MLQETSGLVLELGPRDPFPLAVYNFSKLLRLVVRTKEFYDGYPIMLNRAQLLAIQGPKLQHMEFDCAQSLQIVFGTLLKDSHVPCLETLICRNSCEPFDLDHLLKVPRSVTRLHLLRGKVLSSPRISCVDLAEALPTGIRDIHLSSLIIYGVENANGVRQPMKWPNSLVSIVLSGEMSYSAALTSLPTYLEHLELELTFGDQDKAISVADLPKTLTFVRISCEYLPLLVIDSPLPSSLTYLGLNCAFPSEDSWRFLPPKLKEWYPPAEVDMQKVATANKFAEYLPELEYLELRLEDADTDPNSDSFIKISKLLHTAVVVSLPISLSGISKLLLPDNLKELYLRDLITHPLSDAQFTSDWICGPWDTDFAVLPRALTSMSLENDLERPALLSTPSMWRSLPPHLVSLEISLHSFGGLECFDVLPSTLKTLSLTAGDDCRDESSLSYLRYLWSQSSRLGHHIPSQITDLSLHLRKVGFPWTHWIKGMAEKEFPPQLTTLTVRIHYKSISAFQFPPAQEIVISDDMLADKAQNMDPEIWFPSLPNSLKTFICGINPAFKLPVDVFKQLPRGLANLQFVNPLNVTFSISNDHLTHLPPSLTLLNIRQARGITGDFYSYLPPLIKSIFILDPTISSSTSREKYRNNPVWQGCNLWTSIR
jgi:hypothetical protein